jgi:hypothetical protein
MIVSRNRSPFKTPQKALTGNRVYKGGTTAPNKGPVSAKGASGYVKRELRNSLKNRKRTATKGGIARPIVSPKGKDGASDRRSKVAAMALKRMRSRM